MNTRKPIGRCCALPALLSLLLPSAALGATLTLTPTEDLYISEHFPAPTASAFDMVIGTQGIRPPVNLDKNHGLIRFGGLSQIPAGATISSVKFKFTVTKSPPSPPADFRMHRLLKAWDAASSWFVRLTPDQIWGEPGGAAGTDFAADGSATQMIGDSATYTFESTPALIADVDGWVKEPASNFGWLIKPFDEAIDHTARRIGASEGLAPPPSLEVVYEATPPVVITGSSLSPDGFCLQFQVRAGESYVVERRAALDNTPWTEIKILPPAGTAETVTVCDPLGTGNAFYRVGER